MASNKTLKNFEAFGCVCFKSSKIKPRGQEATFSGHCNKPTLINSSVTLIFDEPVRNL